MGRVDVRSHFDNKEPQVRLRPHVTGTHGRRHYTSTGVERCHGRLAPEKHADNFWLILSRKPIEGLLPPINQIISTEMDPHCSTNIISHWGQIVAPTGLTKYDRRKGKQKIVYFLLQPSVLFFFTEHNMTLNRVWRSVLLCRRFHNTRGNYLDLCHLLNIVGAADRGWSNLPVKAVVILRLAEAPMCEEPSLYSVVKPWHISLSCEIPVDQNVISFTPSGVVEVALLWHKYKNTRVTRWRTATKCVWAQPFIATLKRIKPLIFITALQTS